MTLKDFASYKVREHEPLYGFYHGRKVVTMPLPASGPVLISILNILEGFVGSEFDIFTNVHRIVEAFKFGYSQRTYVFYEILLKLLVWRSSGHNLQKYFKYINGIHGKNKG